MSKRSSPLPREAGERSRAQRAGEGRARHAVVTGASRGIGAAIVKALATQGFRVTGISRSSGVDVTKPDALAAAFARARKDAGPIDILVNNAGAVESMPYLKISDEHWRECMALNLDAVHHGTSDALPEMLTRGWGRIVNIASVAGLRGVPYAAAYSAAKHAVIGLTKSVALEVAGKGVTVNAICPGYVDTDLVGNAVAKIASKTGRPAADARAQLAKSNPSGRLITPDEVAQKVAWLCGDAAGGVNGETIVIE